MNKLVLLSLIIGVALFGCAKEKTASEEKSNKPILAGKEEAKSEITMKAPQEAAQEIQPQEEVDQMRLATEQSIMEKAGAAEESSLEGWSFSVFDPQTGITQYYTTNGKLMGTK